MTEETTPRTPHLAITSLEGQGGAANRRNKTLLMKSSGEITAAVKEALESLGVEIPEQEDKQITEKASYEVKRTALREALEKFKKNSYDWTYIVDFDDTNVVFSIEGGVYATSYTEVDGVISVGETAVEVTSQLSYVDADNTVLFNEGSLAVEENVKQLITKSLGGVASHSETVEVIKNYQEEVKMKSELEAANAELESTKAVLAETKKALEDLQATVENKTQADRKEKLKSFIADEAELNSTLETLIGASDAVFATVLKGYSAGAEVIESSDLMKTVSQKGAVVEKAEAKTTAQMLKERYKV